MKKATKSVWVVWGKSESCDDYGPVVFAQEPPEKTLKKLCYEWDGGEGKGPGAYGSYIHLSVEECSVQ